MLHPNPYRDLQNSYYEQASRQEDDIEDEEIIEPVVRQGYVAPISQIHSAT